MKYKGDEITYHSKLVEKKKQKEVEIDLTHCITCKKKSPSIVCKNCLKKKEVKKIDGQNDCRKFDRGDCGW
jgi:hypothetical protein